MGIFRRRRLPAEKVLRMASRDDRVGYFAKPNAIRIAIYMHKSDTTNLEHKVAYFNAYPATLEFDRETDVKGPGSYHSHDGAEILTIMPRKNGGNPTEAYDAGEFGRFNWNGAAGSVTAVVKLAGRDRASREVILDETLVCKCDFPDYICPCR